MDTYFRLLQLQIFPAILNRKQYRRWHYQQFRHNHKIYGRFFKSESFRTLMDNQVMGQNDQQHPGIGLAPRYFNSTDGKTRYRQWEPANTEKAMKSKGLPIKIISYNILAQNLLVAHLHLYRLCNQMHLKWNYRLAKISEDILAQRPEIVCLQEVQESHLGDILENVAGKLSLNCIYKKKTGFQSDGCAILYNRNLFEIVSSEIVEYYQPGCELLDRHNVGVIVKLRCKSKPEVSFLVSTTHLLYNPKREDVRLAQTMVLLAELDRHSVVKDHKSREVQRIPIILTGDFNFRPKSAPFALINRGKLFYEDLSRKTLTRASYDGTTPSKNSFITPCLGITDSCQHIGCIENNYENIECRLHMSSKSSEVSEDKPKVVLDPKLFSTGTLTHDLNLKSAYDHFGREQYGSTFQNEWITVDHIFYSQPKKTYTRQGSLKFLSLYGLPSVEQCHRIGPIPNAELGSDHLMLGINLYLTFPDET